MVCMTRCTIHFTTSRTIPSRDLPLSSQSTKLLCPAQAARAITVCVIRVESKVEAIKAGSNTRQMTASQNKVVVCFNEQTRSQF
jgi:hypothetical protein